MNIWPGTFFVHIILWICVDDDSSRVGHVGMWDSWGVEDDWRLLLLLLLVLLLLAVVVVVLSKCLTILSSSWCFWFLMFFLHAQTSTVLDPNGRSTHLYNAQCHGKSGESDMAVWCEQKTLLLKYLKHTLDMGVSMVFPKIGVGPQNGWL